MQNIFTQLALFIVALLANLMSAFAGGGAGLIQLPALILLGLPFPIALATHKIASVALGVGAGIRHAKERTLKPLLASIILFSGIPGVILGANLVLYIPDKIATISLGLLTFFLGKYSSERPELGVYDIDKKYNKYELIVGSLVLFFIGILNGSLSSGTGLFVTIWLVIWFRFSYPKAVAYTLICVGLFWNGTGAMVLGLQAEIKWDWILTLIIGSLLGGYFGAHVSLKSGNTLVKKSFELLSMIMGISIIIKSFSGPILNYLY